MRLEALEAVYQVALSASWEVQEGHLHTEGNSINQFEEVGYVPDMYRSLCSKFGALSTG